MKPIQPYLFDYSDIMPAAEDVVRRKGKSVVDKLLKVRRTFDEAEKAYLTPVNRAIEEIRALIRLSNNQREELVLYAIERQGASSLLEVVEDTRIDRKSVETIIDDLIRRNLIYDSARKYVPGSGRPNYILKSRRVKLPEAA